MTEPEMHERALMMARRDFTCFPHDEPSGAAIEPTGGSRSSIPDSAFGRFDPFATGRQWA